jgi:AAA15 family ATPase/GTPase
LENIRKQNLASTDRSIDRHVDIFKSNKKVVIDNLDEKTRKEYLDTFEVPSTKAKAAITDFMITGKINEDLEGIIQKGITAEAVSYESNLAWAAYKDVNNKAAILEKENKELKDQIAKLSGNKGAERGRYQSDQNKGRSDERTPEKGRSIIGTYLNAP